MRFRRRDVARQRQQRGRASSHDHARRDAADPRHHVGRERLRQARVTGPHDQHQVRSLERDPAPQHVRFPIFPVRDARRREDQHALVGIRQGNRQQMKPAATGWVGFQILHGGENHSPGIGIAVQPSDQQHGGRAGSGSGHRQRFDGLSAGAQAHHPAIGFRKGSRQRDGDKDHGNGDANVHPLDPATQVIVLLFQPVRIARSPFPVKPAVWRAGFAGAPGNRRSHGCSPGDRSSPTPKPEGPHRA